MSYVRNFPKASRYGKDRAFPEFDRSLLTDELPPNAPSFRYWSYVAATLKAGEKPLSEDHWTRALKQKIPTIAERTPPRHRA